MLLSVLYGLIGIAILTAFCITGAFLAPPMAYWFMTPHAKGIMENAGISRRFTRRQAVSLTALIVIACILFLWMIVHAGTQGVNAGMNLMQLSLRCLTIFWMTSIFDAVVLDWWMFTKTRLFGIWLKKQTGTPPTVWCVDPQWAGKEIHKLLLEIAASVALAWVFLHLK